MAPILLPSPLSSSSPAFTSTQTTSNIPTLIPSSSHYGHHKNSILPHIPSSPLSPISHIDLRITTIAMLALSAYIIFILFLAAVAKRRRVIRSCRGRRLSFSRFERLVVIELPRAQEMSEERDERRSLLGGVGGGKRMVSFGTLPSRDEEGSSEMETVVKSLRGV